MALADKLMSGSGIAWTNLNDAQRPTASREAQAVLRKLMSKHSNALCVPRKRQWRTSDKDHQHSSSQECFSLCFHKSPSQTEEMGCIRQARRRGGNWNFGWNLILPYKSNVKVSAVPGQEAKNKFLAFQMPVLKVTVKSFPCFAHLSNGLSA